MLHTMLLYNDDLFILRTAVQAAIAAQYGNVTTVDTVYNKLDVPKGGIKLVFNTDELDIIYSGMSLLESRDWPQYAGRVADEYNSREGRKTGDFHPSFGYDPRRKFMNHQEHIRRELAAGRRA